MRVNEENIVLQLSTGSHEAFDKLYLMYSPLVESFTEMMLKSESDAADICQSIFLKIWERRRTLRDVKSFKSYLYAMTRNAVFNELNKKRMVSINSLPDSVLKEIYAPSEIDKVCEDKDMLMLVEMVIGTLPQKSRDIFYMSRSDRMSHKEIAQAMGLSVKTVEYHISKVLAHLRKCARIIILFF